MSSDHSSHPPTNASHHLNFHLPTQRPLTPFLVPSSPIFVPINAYFVPCLVCCTFLVNVLVCLVLLKPHIRSTTNTILTTMAVADTLTGLCPLPCYLYFYTAGNYREFVSYDWCYIYFCLTDFLPSIFHTTSVWLTMVLAIQRYLSVCHAHTSRWLCTINNATLAAGCVLVAAIMSQIGRFVEMDYFPVVLKSNLMTDSFYEEVDPSPTVAMESPEVVGCSFAMKKALVSHQHVYFNAYYMFRIMFIHFIPCMTLIIINFILTKTMREGQTRRTRLLKMNRLSESRRLAEVNRTTLMLVVVVALFLVVEVPSAVVFILHVLQNSFNLVRLINYRNAENVTTAINLVILLSYPMNFFIYCAMSTQFRTGFVQLFKRDSNFRSTANQRRHVAPKRSRSRSNTDKAIIDDVGNSCNQPIIDCEQDPKVFKSSI